MQGITISRTTELPAWLNLFTNITILVLTFKIVELNQRHLIDSSRMIRLLEKERTENK